MNQLSIRVTLISNLSWGRDSLTIHIHIWKWKRFSSILINSDLFNTLSLCTIYFACLIYLRQVKIHLGATEVNFFSSLFYTRLVQWSRMLLSLAGRYRNRFGSVCRALVVNHFFTSRVSGWGNKTGPVWPIVWCQDILWCHAAIWSHKMTSFGQKDFKNVRCGRCVNAQVFSLVQIVI